MTPSDALRREVLERLAALEVAHPERSAHLTIDVAQRGEPWSVSAVQRTLWDLWEERLVVHVGRGWRLPETGGGVQMEVGDG